MGSDQLLVDAWDNATLYYSMHGPNPDIPRQTHHIAGLVIPMIDNPSKSATQKNSMLIAIPGYASKILKRIHDRVVTLVVLELSRPLTSIIGRAF